jgi:phosphate transport system substrate-binding protein
LRLETGVLGKEDIMSKRLVLIACMLIVSNQFGVHCFAQDKDSLKILGSKYVAFTLMDLAKAYTDQRPSASIRVEAVDPVDGLQSFLKQSCDALAVFGQLEPDERDEAKGKGMALTERIIGWGAVALITHPKNPVTELSMDQVKKIFSGDYKNWRQVGGPDLPIVVITRDEATSGTERLFRDLVLDGAPVLQESRRLLSYDIVRAVLKEPGSIADARYTEAIRGRIRGMAKILALKKDEDSPAVMPSAETLRNRTYRLSAPMAIYYDSKQQSAMLQAFTEFCSKRGLGERFAEFQPK